MYPLSIIKWTLGLIHRQFLGLFTGFATEELTLSLKLSDSSENNNS